MTIWFKIYLEDHKAAGQLGLSSLHGSLLFAVLGCSSTKQALTYWRNFSRSHQDSWRLEHLPCEEMLMGQVLLRLEKTQLWEGIVKLSDNTDGAKLFSELCSN